MMHNTGGEFNERVMGQAEGLGAKIDTRSPLMVARDLPTHKHAHEPLTQC